MKCEQQNFSERDRQTDLKRGTFSMAPQCDLMLFLHTSKFVPLSTRSEDPTLWETLVSVGRPTAIHMKVIPP